MASRLASLAGTVIGIYAALVAAYYFTCLIVARLNRGKEWRKLQVRVESAEQIRRDRRQSVVSLGVIATLFGCGGWTWRTLHWGLPAPGHGLAGMVGSFLLSMLLFDTWFYWLHRLIHSRALYAMVHRWHHLTMAPEVWTNNSDLLLDNLFLQTYWLAAHWLIPAAPAALFAHKLYDTVTGVIGHSGYEYAGIFAYPPSPIISVTHHDQHHRFVHCNYSTHFTFWDRLMGTLHRTHDAELSRNLIRKRNPPGVMRFGSSQLDWPAEQGQLRTGARDRSPEP